MPAYDVRKDSFQDLQMFSDCLVVSGSIRKASKLPQNKMKSENSCWNKPADQSWILEGNENKAFQFIQIMYYWEGQYNITWFLSQAVVNMQITNIFNSCTFIINFGALYSLSSNFPLVYGFLTPISPIQKLPVRCDSIRMQNFSTFFQQLLQMFCKRWSTWLCKAPVKHLELSLPAPCISEIWINITLT